MDWKNNSFFIKPIFPPNPAISVVHWTRVPVFGNNDSSLLSTVQMCLMADFNVGPHCSLTLKLAVFIADKSRMVASYCKLCLNVPISLESKAKSNKNPLSFWLYPDHGYSPEWL